MLAWILLILFILLAAGWVLCTALFKRPEPWGWIIFQWCVAGACAFLAASTDAWLWIATVLFALSAGWETARRRRADLAATP